MFDWAYVIMSASEPICLHEWRTANCSTKYVKTMLDYAGYQKFIWERDIEAYETDKEKIEICKERLNAVLREYDIDGVRRNIRNRDYLKAQMKKYSYVIGNPPYITITHKIQKEKINMNNKKIMKVTSTIPLLLTLALTACGTQNSQTLTMVEEVTQTDGTRETDTNTEVAADTESPLAQRDALEWEQRLDYSSERQMQLAEITVDLTQDAEEVQSKAQVLLEAMAGGDAETAVDSILTEDWYTVMLSDLLIGQRNYTGAADNGEWRMMILADELGQHCTAIEYPLADGRQFYVQVTDPEIRYYVCAAERTGSFVSESLNLTDGTYVGYEGTLSSNNRPEGAFTVHMGTADLSSGAADAFRNRSAQAVSYDGDFTAEGRPETATPEYLSKEGQMAYASRQEGKNIYYLTMTAEDGNDAFAPVRMGICNIWE